MSGALLTLASPFLRNAASEDARRFTALLTVYLLPDSDAGVNRVGVYPEIPDDDPVLFTPFPALPALPDDFAAVTATPVIAAPTPADAEVIPPVPSIILLSLLDTLYAILNTFP